MQTKRSVCRDYCIAYYPPAGHRHDDQADFAMPTGTSLTLICSRQIARRKSFRNDPQLFRVEDVVGALGRQPIQNGSSFSVRTATLHSSRPNTREQAREQITREDSGSQAGDITSGVVERFLNCVAGDTIYGASWSLEASSAAACFTSALSANRPQLLYGRR